MATTFPLSVGDFIERFPISSITMSVGESLVTSRTRSGEVLRADLGIRPWQGKVELGRMLPEEYRAVQPLLMVAASAAASFMVYDTQFSGPLNDPSGAILGSATPAIGAVDIGARSIRIKDLPAGYQLVRGDRIAFTYGTNPVRYSLHSVVNQIPTADGAGLTPFIELTPPPPIGPQVDDPVSLIKPSCKAVIVPGTMTPATKDRWLAQGASFEFIQTLR
ncbi:MAG: hypothetical protein AAGM84_05635 [Pseudomonadota bacterium]